MGRSYGRLRDLYRSCHFKHGRSLEVPVRIGSVLVVLIAIYCRQTKVWQLFGVLSLVIERTFRVLLMVLGSLSGRVMMLVMVTTGESALRYGLSLGFLSHAYDLELLLVGQALEEPS